MFPRLFKPKWEHPDPGVRAAALAEIEVPAETLARVAAEDPDAGVRMAALARVLDLGLLAGIRAADPDDAVRGAAEARLLALICGPETDPPALDARLARLHEGVAPGLAARVAREARLPEVRLAAVGLLSDTGTLCAIASQDGVAAVRHAAFARIEEPAGWAQVARECRDRDRQVSRLAREKVEAHERAALALATAERLCQELEGLDPTSPDLAAACRRLAREWEGLGSPPPADLGERFERARAAAGEALARQEALGAQRRARCEELEALAGALAVSADEDPGALPERIRIALRSAGLRWGELEALAPVDPALERRFAAVVAELDGRAVRSERDARRARALEALLAAGHALLESPGPLTAARVADLQRRWERQPVPEGEALAGRLQGAFADLLQTLQGRLERQTDQRRKALEQAASDLQQLEQRLGEGALHDALSLVDRIRHRLRVAGDLNRRESERLERRLHHLQPRIEELRRWRHWGSGQAREELCQEMETLAASALAPSDLAQKVRAARDAWRRIDHDEGPAPQSLWHRFDAACTQAYEPYRRQLEQQARARERHLETRRAQVQELEALEQATDWEHPQWSEVDQRLRDLQRRWERAAPVPRQPGKAVERAFREVLARVDGRLDAERAREVARRRALIERLQALAEAPDARGAVREAREAQQGWRPSVPAAQREERALWEAFRAARDAVFARSLAERAEADAGRRENLARKQAVCTALEELLHGEALADPHLGRRVQELERRWRETGPIPRDAERPLEERFRGLRARVAEARRDQVQARAGAELDGLQRRAELCAELERAALAGAPGAADLLAATRTAWEGLSPLAAQAEAPLRRRLECAAAAVDDSQARAALLRDLAGNRSRRLALCLELEVLAGVESPPEAREERMRLQVARLAQALRERRGDPASPWERLQALEREWYALGPVAADLWGPLGERFAAARAAARAQLGGPSPQRPP